MAKIFVSYSRKDIEFARKLTDELQKNDLDFWVDWEGIPPTVDWWKQIEKGIEEADVFLFLISPDSTSSKICAQEIDCAVKNGKRLIPLVVRDIKGDEAPAQLGHINWIFFRKTDDFDASTTKLLTAIQTDYEWAQTHRRLQVKALEWERNNHESSFLLRGKDLQDAELQLATNTSKEPHPTDLQREHVLKSRQAADRQRRITAGISAAGIIALAVLAVFGFVQAGAARIAQAEAERQAQAAIAAQERAEQEQAKAETAQLYAESETRIATSGRLALESENSLLKYPQRALLLALEAVKVNEDANEPVRPDAEEALRVALQRVTGIGLTGFQHEVNLVQFTNDNRWLVAGTNALEGEVKIWNLEKTLSDPSYQPFYVSFPVEYLETFSSDSIWSTSIDMSPQTSWFVVTSQSESKLWQVEDEDEIREPLVFGGKIEFANLNDDNFILEDQTQQVVYWQIDPKTLTKDELASYAGSLVKLSDDRKYLITDDAERGLLLWNLAALSSQPTLLTEKHAYDFFYTNISPTNEWLILFESKPREEYQLPRYSSQPPYDQIGTDAWNSTTIVLIPLEQTKKQEFRIDLEFAVNLSYLKPKFSEDGKSFVYSGSNPPDEFGNSQAGNIGVLRFDELAFTNLTNSSFSEGYSQISFVKNNWLYIETYDYTSYSSIGKFIDLRENDLFVNGETSLTLLMDSKGNVTFTEDEDYLITQSGNLINFHQLDFNQFISVEPAPQDSGIQTSNSLEIELKDNYQNLGMENYANISAESKDGAWFAAGGFDGSIRVWNNLNPREDASLQLTAYPNYVALSNDNQWLAINGTIWQLENGKPKKAYPFETELTTYGSSNIPLAVFSPDSRWLMYLTYQFDVPSDTSVYNFNVNLIDLNKLAEDGKIVSMEVSKRDSFYNTIQFSQNSQWVLVGAGSYYSGSNSGQPSFVYDLNNKKYYELPSETSIFSFTEDQKHIVFAVGENQGYSTIWKGVEVWSLPAQDRQTLEKIGKLEVEGYPVISQNGRWLITSPLDYSKYESQLWDLSCVLTNSECKSFALSANNAGFSPNSQYIVSYYSTTHTEDGSETPIYEVWSEIWSLQNNTPEQVKVNKGELINTPSIGNTGNWVLFTKPVLSSYIYPSITTAGSYSSWAGYAGLIPNATTFDGHGHLVLGGGGGGGYAVGGYQSDYSVEAFHTGTQSSLLLRGHESNVSISQISPNEKFVLTNSGNPKDDNGEAEKLLRLWDLEKMSIDPAGKPIVLPLQLDSKGLDIQALAFSPNSEWVYVVDSKSTLHFYPISIQELKEHACIAVGRNLTLSEWERFFPNTEYRKTCENLPAHPSAISQ